MLSPAKKIQMTPWVGRWQTASGPLYYKQTNQQLKQTASYRISPPASQHGAPDSCLSILRASARNQCVIIFTPSLAGDIGARHGIEMTRSAQRGHMRSQTHSNHFLSLFRSPFHSVPNSKSLQITLDRGDSFSINSISVTEEAFGAGLFFFFLHATTEWLYIARALPPSTVSATSHHLSVHKHLTARTES